MLTRGGGAQRKYTTLQGLLTVVPTARFDSKDEVKTQQNDIVYNRSTNGLFSDQ